MPLTAKEGNGAQFPPVPMGLHLAVSYGIWDLGTHTEEKWNKDVHKILISWEIPGERIDIEKDGKEQNLPRVISNSYRLSLHKKANLRRDLESWRGKVFTPEELEGFDVYNVLGASCQLNIIHNEKDKKVYANISSIVPAPKGTKLEPENPTMIFSFEDYPEKGIPEGTPDWIKEIIKDSQEWLGMMEDKETGVDPKARKQQLADMNKKDRSALTYKLINEKSYTPPEGSKLVEDMTSGEQIELILHLEGMEGELPF